MYSVCASYKHYKQEIREDCQGRCVYCDAHENEIGGLGFMSLDHFKPKDKYPELRNNPTNLVWACQQCNQAKRNTWPAFGTSYTVIGDRGFINPFEENPHKYFRVLADGTLEPIIPPAQYMITMLVLNRSGAKKIREMRNNRWKRKKQFEVFYETAIKRIDNLLANPTMPSGEKDSLLQHKQEITDTYMPIIKSCDPDWTLY